MTFNVTNIKGSQTHSFYHNCTNYTSMYISAQYTYVFRKKMQCVCAISSDVNKKPLFTTRSKYGFTKYVQSIYRSKTFNIFDQILFRNTNSSSFYFRSSCHSTTGADADSQRYVTMTKILYFSISITYFFLIGCPAIILYNVYINFIKISMTFKCSY